MGLSCVSGRYAFLNSKSEKHIPETFSQAGSGEPEKSSTSWPRGARLLTKCYARTIASWRRGAREQFYKLAQGGQNY